MTQGQRCARLVLAWLGEILISAVHICSAGNAADVEVLLNLSKSKVVIKLKSLDGPDCFPKIARQIGPI